MQYQNFILATLFCLVSIDSIESYSRHQYPQSPLDYAQEETLDLLSYNVWALPVWLPKVGLNKRFDKIGKTLISSKYDIICFQEAFMKRFRKKIFSELGKAYYSDADYLCSNTILGPIKRDCNGGLMTFSKFPILFESFIEFPIYEDMRIEEQIGHKGFLISLIDGPKGHFYVINTHLYAGPKERDEFQRLKQIEYMSSIIKEELFEENLPIILMGDLNIDHPYTCKQKGSSTSPVYSYITKLMGFVDTAPEIGDKHFTVDRSRNKYSGSKNGKQKLDYCLYRTPEDIVCNIIRFGTDFFGSMSFSDHLGFYSSIHIERKNNINSSPSRDSSFSQHYHPSYMRSGNKPH